MQIKLTLDENIDSELITKLTDLAKDSPLSKALYLLVYDLLHFRAYSAPIQAQSAPIQALDNAESGPAELAESLKEIEEGW